MNTLYIVITQLHNVNQSIVVQSEGWRRSFVTPFLGYFVPFSLVKDLMNPLTQV